MRQAPLKFGDPLDYANRAVFVGPLPRKRVARWIKAILRRPSRLGWALIGMSVGVGATLLSLWVIAHA